MLAERLEASALALDPLEEILKRLVGNSGCFGHVREGIVADIGAEGRQGGQAFIINLTM